MAIYRLQSVRIMAQTYGAPFTPNTRSGPTIVVEWLPQYQALNNRLNELRDKWSSGDYSTIEDAFLQVMDDLSTTLTSSSNHYKVVPDIAGTAAYRPLYNSQGQLVGHDTVGWITNDGDPIIVETPLGGGQVPDPVFFVPYIYIVLVEA